MNNQKNSRVDLIATLAQYDEKVVNKEQILNLLEDNNVELTDQTCANLIIHMVSTYKPEKLEDKDDEIQREFASKGKRVELARGKKVADNTKYKEIILAVKEHKASLNWIEIFKLIDNPTFKINSLDAFYLMIDLWSIINGNNTFPYGLFFTIWQNKQAQTEFIMYLMESDPQKTNVFSNVFLTKIASYEDIKKGKINYEDDKDDKIFNVKNPFTTYKKMFLKTHETNFNCVELFKCISNLESSFLIERARDLAPDWCLLGLSFIQPKFESLFENLFFDLLKSEKYSGIVKILYKQCPALVVEKMAKSIELGVSLCKILDIVLEAKMLPFILDTLNPPFFSFEILVLSSKREHLNIYFWMRNMYQNRKDQFINIFIWYMTEKFSNVDINEIYNYSTASDDQQEAFQRLIFPLTIELSVSLIKNLEQLNSLFSKDTAAKFTKLKSILPVELKTLANRRSKIENISNEFITSITSGKKSISEGLINLQNYIKGELYQREIAINIFVYLVENFNNFHKLDNYDIMAIFYGKTIENKIIPGSLLNKAINNVVEVLRNRTTGLQCKFALICLENMYNYLKKEKRILIKEIENFESVKQCIKEEEYFKIKENENIKGISLNELISELFSRKKDIGVIETEFNENIASGGKINSVLNQSKNDKTKIEEIFNNILLGNFFVELHNVDFYNKIISYYLENKIYEYKNYDAYVKFFDSLGEDFFDHFLHKSVQLLRSMLNYNVDKFIEINLSSALGTILGKMTIAQNKIFTIDVFNMKDFVLQCTYRKKYALCVYFVISFMRQGIYGRVFVPYNPWFMRILSLVTDLHTINTNIHNEITQLYKLYNIKFSPKEILLETNFNKILYLANYSLENHDFIIKHVVSLAIDFSVREVCTGFIDKTCEIVYASGLKLFNTIKIEESKERLYFYNLLLNLGKSLTSVASQDAVKDSITSNINYFINGANLFIEKEEVQKIVNLNFLKCCKLIERAVLTKLDNMFVKAYKEYQLNKKNDCNDIVDQTKKYTRYICKNSFTNSSSSSLSNKEFSFDLCNISIITENPFFEKIEIKPVMISELNEIKSMLANISKRTPNKKISIVNREWVNLIKFLDNKKIYGKFEKIISLIEENDSKDELYESFCQCIVGYILKNGCQYTVLLEMLSKIFFMSFKTAREVLQWLIYSEDERKLNVDLICKFIEYDLINLAEYDQHLSKCIRRDEKYYKFVLNLLNKLITSKIKICTPYDFVYTIEALSRINEEKYDDKIFDILKKISDMMMPVEYFYEIKNGIKFGSVDGICIFEEKTRKKIYLGVDYYKNIENKCCDQRNLMNQKEKTETNYYMRNINTVFGPKEILNITKEFENINIKETIKQNVNSKGEVIEPKLKHEFPLTKNDFIYVCLGGLHVTWDSFIRNCKMPSLYSFNKISNLIDFVATVDDFYLILRILTPYYIESLIKENYLFQKLFTFIVIVLIKKTEKSFKEKNNKLYENFILSDNEEEYKSCISAFLKVISPKKLSIFVYSFLEIISLDYVLTLFTKKENFYAFREILGLLDKNDRLLHVVTQFFMILRDKHNSFFVAHCFYLSIFLNNKYVYLKNMFNANREIDFEMKIIPMDFTTYRSTYLSIVNYLKGEINERIIVKFNGLEEKQKIWVIYTLIDCLGKRNVVSENALVILKMCESEFGMIKHICMARDIENAPEMLLFAIEEMKLRDK